MTKYIQELIDKFKSRKSGMQKNDALWNNQPVTTDDIDGHIGELEGVDKQIEAAKDTLQQKRQLARQMRNDKLKDLQQVDHLAEGLHKDDPEKLNEYDIKLPKPGEAKPVPEKAVIESIEDDVDGEGFIINIKAQRNIAEHYEIERGIAPNPENNVLATPYPFLKTTRKSEYLDDDVLPGKRYFYRVRAINSTGAGEWSEPVSAVQ